MANKKKTRLSDIDLSMVSLVRAGDDPLAKAVLFKSEPDKNNGGDSTPPTLSNQNDKERKPVAETEISKSDLPEEVVAYIEALEDEVTEQEETIKSLKVTIETDDEVEVDDDPEAVLKSAIAKADPATAELLRKMQADNAAAAERIEKAEKVANDERNERLRRDYVAKAAELPMVNDNADDLGKLLKELNDLSPAHAAQVETLLKAANEQIAKGNLFAEFGQVGVGTTSASAEAAAAVVKTANPDLTEAQALAKAYADNPALYDESLKG